MFITDTNKDIQSNLTVCSTVYLTSYPVHAIYLRFTTSVNTIVFVNNSSHHVTPRTRLVVRSPLVPRKTNNSTLTLRRADQHLVRAHGALARVLSSHDNLAPGHVRSLATGSACLSTRHTIRLNFTRRVLSAAGRITRIWPHRPPHHV